MARFPAPLTPIFYKVSIAKSKEEALKLLLDIRKNIELRKIARIEQMLEVSG